MLFWLNRHTRYKMINVVVKEERELQSQDAQLACKF